MKNWKIVWSIITGRVFSREFETLEEMEEWASIHIGRIRPIASAFSVWELIGSDYKMRYNWRV